LPHGYSSALKNGSGFDGQIGANHHGWGEIDSSGIMELTDTQLNYFVNNRLKLPKGKRAEYLAQVDNLIERFTAVANGDKVIDIKKFLKTGSLRKGTVLAPKGDFGVDADVAVFLNVTSLIC
jgi:hypothetical protein